MLEHMLTVANLVDQKLIVCTGGVHFVITNGLFMYNFKYLIQTVVDFKASIGEVSKYNAMRI